ncbi:MAG: hypothetical protein KJ626_03675 [Verrucomicrobia bacterium]|nr:hypothetical protein [Verrucomicrobiota bacterium]
MKRALTTLLLIIIGTSALWQSGRLHRPLLEMRAEYRLNPADPLENMPPLVAFTTVALGGFRGILADALWLRASSLQEEGKYFELVQLADWITKLEPRFSMVWAFHAWNLSYNVSVMFTDKEDRWRWVKHGFELLRDEGLHYNPGSASLYRELGWIFQHKIGGWTDSCHLYYKQQWANEMSALFQGPRPDYAAPPPELKQKYKLSPATMQEIEAAFGPLDWKRANTHAVYWAWVGRKYGQGFDVVACDRMIYQSIGDSFLRGSLVADLNRGEMVATADISVLMPALRAFDFALGEYPENESFQTAHANFLRGAVLALLGQGMEEESRELFAMLRIKYPEFPATETFEEGVYRILLAREQVRPEQLEDFIIGLYFRSFYWTALGRYEESKGGLVTAQICYDESIRSGAYLPAAERLKEAAYAQALESATHPDARERLEELVR